MPVKVTYFGYAFSSFSHFCSVNNSILKSNDGETQRAWLTLWLSLHFAIHLCSVEYCIQLHPDTTIHLSYHGMCDNLWLHLKWLLVQLAVV